jgi:peptide/nickel transport system substrate-binding protein
MTHRKQKPEFYLHPVVKIFIFLLFLSIIHFSCNQKQRNVQKNTVTIWEIDDPKGMNPLTAYDATSTYAKNHIFQRLLNYDYNTFGFLPVISKSRPEIKIEADSTMQLAFDIRDEATWPNGTSITPDDVIFSIKAIMAPGVNTAHLKPYLDFITGFEKDGNHLIIKTNKVHVRAEANIGYEVPIIPEYFYDPHQALRKYTIEQLIHDTTITSDEQLNIFVNRMNSTVLNHEPDSIIGSGAYALVEWKTGNRLVLKRKSNWWGDKLNNENMYFEAYPDEITYQIINDQTAAITAMKAGQLDVMRSIKTKDFKNDLQQNKKFLKSFNLHTPPTFGYSFIAINERKPMLEDKKTRQALAYLVDYERLVNDVLYGFGQRTVGPVPPFIKKFYNKDIIPYSFNTAKAKQLLTEAGWEDSDGDGILDKTINGKLQDFEISFLINKGHSEKEKIALIIQQALQQAGIKMNIQSIDWSVFNEKLFAYDFDLVHLALIGDPAPEDFSQLWHTSAANGGFNFFNFGDAESDALIEKINITIDENERADLIRALQQKIADEVPCIFLWNTKNRIAINKRFSNTRPSAFKPGYWTAGFKVE